MRERENKCVGGRELRVCVWRVSINERERISVCVWMLGDGELHVCVCEHVPWRLPYISHTIVDLHTIAVTSVTNC